MNARWEKTTCTACRENSAADEIPKYKQFLEMGAITYEEINAFIDKCIKAGYDVDYSRDKDSFSEEDTDGNELNISYEYFDVMNIDLN